jgi:hypothetical protein
MRAEPGNFFAARRAQGAGACRTPFQSTQASECRGVWIRLLDHGPPRQRFEAFGRRVALRAQRTDLIGSLRLFSVVFVLADEAAAAHTAEHRPGLA